MHGYMNVANFASYYLNSTNHVYGLAILKYNIYGIMYIRIYTLKAKTLDR